MFDLIAFDADDTLWENEAHYEQAREHYHQILKSYPVPENLDALLDATENRNIPYFGYGVSSFIFSLVETAIQTTQQQISAADIQRIIDLARRLLDTKIDLYDHAEPTLRRLSQSFPLMMITKGDLLHQQNKIVRSGLGSYFQHFEVVADKTCEIYLNILNKHGVEPARFLMVGNSMRSDILPVLELGGYAVYIPGKSSWSHEHAVLPETLKNRFKELEHLGQIADWIETFQP